MDLEWGSKPQSASFPLCEWGIFTHLRHSFLFCNFLPNAIIAKTEWSKINEPHPLPQCLTHTDTKPNLGFFFLSPFPLILILKVALRDTYPLMGFPASSAGKESTCNEGDLGLILGLGRSPRGGNGYPLQYSGLENFMDCIDHGVTKSWMWLTFTLSFNTQAFQ